MLGGILIGLMSLWADSSSHVVGNFGFTLLTAAALLATPKAVTSLFPAEWLERRLAGTPRFVKRFQNPNNALKAAVLGVVLVVVGWLVRRWTSQGVLGFWIIFAVGLVAISVFLLLMILFQAAYRDPVDETDLCAGLERELSRLLGKEPVWKLVGILIVAGTVLVIIGAD